MKVLLTGFDPFGGESINPSWQAACALKERVAAAAAAGDATAAQIEIHLHRLPVVFGACSQELIGLMDELQPNVVLCLGQAEGRAQITPEFVGINWRSARIPDNAGAQPQGERIAAHGPDAHFATLPVQRMVAAATDKGIPAAVSYTAGTYCCNELLYCALDHAAQTMPACHCDFVHVPLLPEQAAAQAQGRPSMSLELMVEGLWSMLRSAVLDD